MNYLIVVLGNIGREYADTRHNIGFMVADQLVKEANASFSTLKLASYAEYKQRGHNVYVIKPTTYMNLSGKAFKYWMDKEKIAIENTLTIVDDLALPIEKLRLRPSGTDAGHNGLKDIQSTLGTDKYPKLRFGIGNNYAKGMQVEFVLSKWLNKEIPLIDIKIQLCVDAIENFAAKGIELTMNDVNKLCVTI